MILPLDVSIQFTRTNKSLIAGGTVVVELFRMHPDPMSVQMVRLVTLVLALSTLELFLSRVDRLVTLEMVRGLEPFPATEGTLILPVLGSAFTWQRNLVVGLSSPLDLLPVHFLASLRSVQDGKDNVNDRGHGMMSRNVNKEDHPRCGPQLTSCP